MKARVVAQEKRALAGKDALTTRTPAPTLGALMSAMDTMSPGVGQAGAADRDEEPPETERGHRAAFDAFVLEARALVEARLEPWLSARVEAARAHGREVAVVADSLRHLVLRGGKRLRAVLLASAYVACGGEDVARVAAAGAALELLQAYLLTHDDWMDGDEVRRGGPSVPAMMRAHFGAGEGAAPSVASSASILAGDLAASWALASMLELELAPERVLQAMRELARVEQEVVHGQVLDVCRAAGEVGDIEAAYALKTASYTVRGPIVIGARLAGAPESDVAALSAYAEPLGIAFQLRDDLLGAFGDVRTMGKPSGGDLRKGKRTALVVEAMRDARTAEPLARILGKRDAREHDVAAVLAALESSGARARVERRIAALAQESRAALARASLTEGGRELLAQAAIAMTERDR